jgi:hypothetical protein
MKTLWLCLHPVHVNFSRAETTSHPIPCPCVPNQVLAHSTR